MKKRFTLQLIFLLPFLLMAYTCNLGIRDQDRAEVPPGIDGFFVHDGKLYDAEGYSFQMRGANTNHWWDSFGELEDYLPLVTVSYLKAAGANAARLVFGPMEIEAGESEPNPWYYQCLTRADRKKAVEEYIKYKIVPVVEYHNATGYNDPDAVDEAVNFWISEKEWLTDYSRYVILNITNEWGNRYTGADDYEGITHKIWADTYMDAITKLRDNGIKNLIVIDTFDYGHSLACVLDYGDEILEHDPMHNVMFSIHAYGGWYSSQSEGIRNIEDYVQGEGFVTEWQADHALELLEEKKLTVIFGEFSQVHTASLGGGGAPDSELIEDFNAHGAGWLYWMWWNSSGMTTEMVLESTSFSYTSTGAVVQQYWEDAQEATSFPRESVPDLPEE